MRLIVDVDDLALAGQGRPLVVVFAHHSAGPAGSSLTPRATIRSDPFGSGRCSFSASSAVAVIRECEATAGREASHTSIRARKEAIKVATAGRCFLLTDGRGELDGAHGGIRLHRTWM